MRKPLITFARADELLSYDPATGIITNRSSRHGMTKAGTTAGGLNRSGYRYIRVDGRRYAAHRLAWLLTHGCWPTGDIDHVNGDRADNRLANLREATRLQNAANARRPCTNTSGYKGVHWATHRRKWRASIGVNYRKLYLGYFATPQDAHAAYIAAAAKYFGSYARAA